MPISVKLLRHACHISYDVDLGSLRGSKAELRAPATHRVWRQSVYCRPMKQDLLTLSKRAELRIDRRSICRQRLRMRQATVQQDRRMCCVGLYLSLELRPLLTSLNSLMCETFAASPASSIRASLPDFSSVSRSPRFKPTLRSAPHGLHSKANQYRQATRQVRKGLSASSTLRFWG